MAGEDGKHYTCADVCGDVIYTHQFLFLIIISYIHRKYIYIVLMFVCLMVFNGTFNNISVISWLSVLLVEETGGPRETHRHRVKQGTIIQRIFPFDTERILKGVLNILYVHLKVQSNIVIVRFLN